MQLPLYKIFLCDIINPQNDKECHYYKRGALVQKRKGEKYLIEAIGFEKDLLPFYAKKRSLEVVELVDQLMIPTFFDMHFHWVQDDVCLMPKEDLLDWLANFTWPNEAKFSNKKFAKKKVSLFAKKLLSVGTLGGGCYASIHGHTVDLGIDNFVGDFVVGNVLMTMNSPDYLVQSEKEAIRLVAKKANRFKKHYAMTPRFAITTSPEVMKEGARIATLNNSFIQSHLSETSSEINFVLDLYRKYPEFKGVKSYTEIYDRCGVLGPKTIMGHGIHLSSSELKLLSRRKTSIAHCPTSNAPVDELGLGAGLFDYRKVERAGIEWALGSDIGGGPFLSMFDVIRSFIEQNDGKPTFSKGLYRATLAGAKILGIDSRVGNLNPGKEGNFILLDRPDGKLQSVNKVFGALIFGHSRTDFEYLVKSSYYRGHQVFES